MHVKSPTKAIGTNFFVRYLFLFFDQNTISGIISILIKIKYFLLLNSLTKMLE